jgi:hypothetical protein
MKIFVIYITIIFILSSCKENPQPEIKTKKTESAEIINPFDSLMEKLVQKYPELPTPQLDSLKFSDVYSIEKRLYIRKAYFLPGGQYITLELRQESKCGGCWEFEVIYIYNDRNHFVLPLTDFHNFYRYSGTQTKEWKELKKELNLGSELNNLNKLYKAEFKGSFIHAIMDFLGYYPVTKHEIPKLKMIAEEIHNYEKENSRKGIWNFYSKNCRNKLYKNIKRIEIEVKKDKKALYSNGLFIFIFSYNDKYKIIDLEVLNYECASRIMF